MVEVMPGMVVLIVLLLVSDAATIELPVPALLEVARLLFDSGQSSGRWWPGMGRPCVL